MTRRWCRRSFLGLLAGTAGCQGRSSDSTATTGTPSPTKRATESPTRSETEPRTAEPSDAETASPTPEPVEVREWPEEYYQGPLVSAHEHMHAGNGYSVIQKEVEWFVRWMDRNRVDQVIGFASDRYMDTLVEYDDRFLPFAFGWTELRNDRDDLPGAFERRLDEWPYVGLGELGFKDVVTPEGEPPLQPNIPEALALWDWAADRDLPVMVHGAEPWRYPPDMREEWTSVDDWPTKSTMADAMAHNRDTQFLVHATYTWHDRPTGRLVADALDNNPNLTYDLSTLSPLAYGEGRFSESAFRDEIENMGGVEAIAQEHYDEYRVILEEYSDRLTWGMDAAGEWHYNDWALDTWVDTGRALLGMLPEENARNIAYRTASDLMGIEVETSA